MESVFTRLGGHVRLLNPIYARRGRALVEVLDKLFDGVSTALRLALDLCSLATKYRRAKGPVNLPIHLRRSSRIP
jgi:hypothetical protein